MDHKLAAVKGVVTLVATVGAYSSDATANTCLPGNGVSSFAITAKNSTTNNTASGDTTPLT